jgi:hypothetical protein
MLVIQGSVGIEEVREDRNGCQAFGQSSHGEVSHVLSPDALCGRNWFENQSNLTRAATLSITALDIKTSWHNGNQQNDNQHKDTYLC